MNIELIEASDSPEAVEIMRGLRGHNAQVHPMSPPTRRPLVLVVRGEDARVTAGLDAYAYWHWLRVERLWVSEALRGRGIGRSLLAQAETIARGWQLRGVELETYEFQAPEFYRKQGYVIHGQLEDCPPGMRRFALHKRLD